MELGRVVEPQGDAPGGPGTRGDMPQAGLPSRDPLISVWKAVAFLFVMVGVVPKLTSTMVLLPLNAIGGVPSIFVLLLLEALNFGVLLGACLLISRLEHRSVGQYGLPRTTAFGGNFWLGFL